MKIPTLLAAAALLAIATAPTATAQDTHSTPKVKKAPTATTPARPRPSVPRKRTRHYAPPPPPSVSLRSAGRVASGSASLFQDSTGRIDKSGRQVGFYPQARGSLSRGPVPQSSAIRQQGTSAPPQNAQKDPYKSPIP